MVMQIKCLLNVTLTQDQGLGDFMFQGSLFEKSWTSPVLMHFCVCVF